MPARVATTIEDVITLMDQLVDRSLEKGDRLGYFASLYRLVTQVVKKRCDEGYFEDCDRMRRLDTLFANRYFAALDAYEQEQPLSKSWQVAFDTCQLRRPIILQHLLMGMNAHINLDLGIAAALVQEGKLEASLERDFDRLNVILGSLVDKVQAEIAEVSPLIGFLERVAWRTDEALVGISIKLARDRAWDFAKSLADLPAEEHARIIAQQDELVARLGSAVGEIRWYALPLVWLISLRESKDIRRVVACLSNEGFIHRLHKHIDATLATMQAQGIPVEQSAS